MRGVLEDYTWDVFLSYAHAPPVGPWVVEFLYPHFIAWLRDKLGGVEPKVFHDTKLLQPGDPWPEDVRRALKTSRCLVAVWSPSYFRSSWCMSEWKSFCERERMASARGLVIPIRHNDGEFFPQEARNTQMADFSNCRSIMPAFFYHAKCIEFEDKVEKFAEAVANAIRQSPRYRPDWPVVESSSLDGPQPALLRLEPVLPTVPDDN